MRALGYARGSFREILMRLLTTSSLSLIAALSLSACATIIEGSDDQVMIQTTPPSSATCNLTSKRGTYSGYAGNSIAVKKSRSDLNVICADPRTGARGEGTIVSDVEPWAFGNILIGGIIGLAVDWSSGAAYNYPGGTTIPLGMPGAYAPQPAAMPYSAAPQPSMAAPVVGTPYPQPQVAPQTIAPQPANAPVYHNYPAPAQAAPAAPFGTGTPAAPRSGVTETGAPRY